VSDDADDDTVLDVSLTPDEILMLTNMNVTEMIEFFEGKVVGALSDEAKAGLTRYYHGIVESFRRVAEEDPVFRKVQ
jgi:hypothetical protein